MGSFSEGWNGDLMTENQSIGRETDPHTEEEEEAVQEEETSTLSTCHCDCQRQAQL